MREADESTVEYVLGSIDLFLFLIATIQLIRIIRNEKQQQQREMGKIMNINAAPHHYSTISEYSGGAPPASPIPSFLRQSYNSNNPREDQHTNHFNTSVVRGDGAAAMATNHTNTVLKKQPVKWSGKKAFHAIIMICMFVRGTFFIMQPFYVPGTLNYPPGIQIMWIQIGELLFLLAYFMLLLFWAQFYYQIEGSSKRVLPKLRIPLIVLFLALTVLTIAFCIWSAVFIKTDKQAAYTDMYTAITLSFMAILVGFGFLYYGLRLCFLLGKFTVLSARKRAQTRKVVLVAVGCTLCFTSRAAIVLASLQSEVKDYKAKEFNTPWAVVITFFLLLEIFPISLMLFLLRKLPSWKTDPTKRPILEST